MTEKKTEFEQGIVVTADGSANNKTGHKGWGYHGYLYSTEPPKRGTGCSTHILTDKGYIDKSEKTKSTKEVTPISYLDAYGSSITLGTNNIAELEAATNAMVKASEYDISKFMLYSDSQYVVKGFNEYLPKWKKNNWLKSDGQPVMNQPYWRDLQRAANELYKKDVKVSVQWVKGHAGDLANEAADRLAGVACLHSMDGEYREEHNVTEANGYWKIDNSRHPFLMQRSMYFNSDIDKVTLGEYYMSDHGKDDELIGKRSSDGHYSVVILKEPDPALELIRQVQCQQKSNIEHLVLARVDQLFKPDIYNDIMKFGAVVLRRLNPRRTDLTFIGQNRIDTPITRELQPPLLAMRAVESLNALRSLLDLYREKSRKIHTCDITDHFFITETKEKTVRKKVVTETITKLDPKITVGTSNFPVTMSLLCDKGSFKKTITLVAGTDILDRNSLKRLEKLNPRIIFVTWQEAPDVLRYATIIETDDGIGVWAGVYSNIIFMDFKEDPTR